MVGAAIGGPNHRRRASADAADPETGYLAPGQLRRPLRPPQLTGGQCTPAAPHRVSPAFGPALGPGPVYAVVQPRFSLILPAEGTEFTGEYGGQKVLWVGDPDYDGRVLIRGVQVDGTNPVRFGRGPDPVAEMQLPPRVGSAAAAGGGWRDWASYTRLRVPGCYAWQVDGAEFSYTITFQVVGGG